MASVVPELRPFGEKSLFAPTPYHTASNAEMSAWSGSWAYCTVETM